MWCPICKERNVTTVWRKKTVFNKFGQSSIDVPLRVCLNCGTQHLDSEALLLEKEAKHESKQNIIQSIDGESETYKEQNSFCAGEIVIREDGDTKEPFLSIQEMVKLDMQYLG